MTSRMSNTKTDGASASGSLMHKVWLALSGLFVIAAACGWAVDFITLAGERTVYTVDCKNGAWMANRCSGNIVAGDRFRFRALAPHGEVLFWTAGSAEPSGKFTGCTIANGRSWSCPANADAARTITLAMVRGQP